MLSRFARLAVAIGHARVRYLLIAWGVLLGVVLALAAAWFIVNLRSAHIADAERELRNLSLVLAEEVDRGNQGIDLLERGLIEHMRELGIDSPDAFDTTLRSFEVHQDLVHRVASLPYIAGLSLHNTNGSLVNFSIAWPIPPIDTSGRDFIKALLVPHAPKTFISQPLRGQVTGNWTIFVSQRVETPEGQLLGVVVYMALA